ncbi:hypothetical protein S83_008568, partial [Arachis hypogaea]
FRIWQVPNLSNKTCKSAKTNALNTKATIMISFGVMTLTFNTFTENTNWRSKQIGDGKTLNTVAFQNAIFYLKSFTDKGGAQLYVPSGKWLTGSLNLISHLTLFLERGATIIASHISRALAAAGSTEIMKKLSKFMYDEEKALEEDQALAKEAAETVVLVIDEEGVESLISELVKSVNEPKLLWSSDKNSFLVLRITNFDFFFYCSFNDIY